MITTIAGTTTLYFAVRQWLRQRQAWQWWHRRQAAQLHEQAESIRDDLLQQTFAFRRYLESTLVTQPDADHTQQWLDRFQTFYQSLERLSNQLSPPFIVDSLPLALQFMVQNWQHTRPSLVAKLNIPPDWPETSSNNNHIILSVVTGLIELVTTADEHKEQQVQLTLSRHGSICTLTFKQTHNCPTDRQSFICTSEIKHLKEIFRSLTAGRLDIVVEESGLTGQLCWQDK